MALPALLRSMRRARPLRLPAGPVANLEEAEAFLRMFYAEHDGPGGIARRLAGVRAEVERTGTYVQTQDELRFAARVAWRHAARCTGRDKWRTLRLRDRRQVHRADEVARETIAHLREVTDCGRVKSCITVFAPDTPLGRGPRVVNGQVLRYAGYRRPGGGVIGDPLNVPLTDLAVSLGWEPGRGEFDLLPLIVAGPDGRPHLFPVPADAVLEVPISHPEFGWFAELKLRWYAVPLIADMYLDAGGIRYPCVPFNGWYQAGTEVGVRNLGDAARYNMLPAVAAGMGLDMGSPATFWMDKAVVELAVAVHHSFKAAGVMVTDHHSEAARFTRFTEAEEQAHRPWCADWAWINPPVSASTTPTFHRTFPNPELKPGFFRHAEPVPAVP